MFYELINVRYQKAHRHWPKLLKFLLHYANPGNRVEKYAHLKKNKKKKVDKFREIEKR